MKKILQEYKCNQKILSSEDHYLPDFFLLLCPCESCLVIHPILAEGELLTAGRLALSELCLLSVQLEENTSKAIKNI